MIGAKYDDNGYDVFLICSVTVIGNRLAYITSIGWREFWLREILVISILINKLCKHLLSSSFLFPKWGKIFHTAYLLHTYVRSLKVVGNWSYTLYGSKSRYPHRRRVDDDNLSSAFHGGGNAWVRIIRCNTCTQT
jgi:hypothetical protein